MCLGELARENGFRTVRWTVQGKRRRTEEAKQKQMFHWASVQWNRPIQISYQKRIFCELKIHFPIGFGWAFSRLLRSEIVVLAIWPLDTGGSWPWNASIARGDDSQHLPRCIAQTGVAERIFDMTSEKPTAVAPIPREDPQRRLALVRREFGEWGGVNCSTEQSVTFTVMQADVLPKIFGGELNHENGGCYLYGRSFAPTVFNLGRQIAALEGTEAAYCTASGMSAISATFLALCSAGDAIVSSRAVYGGTHALLKDFLPLKCNIHTRFVDIADLQDVEVALKENKPKVLYTESLANPTLACANIPALSKLAHSYGAALVVDNTFSPMLLSPARLGADVVIHSLTKFVSSRPCVVFVDIWCWFRLDLFSVLKLPQILWVGANNSLQFLFVYQAEPSQHHRSINPLRRQRMLAHVITLQVSGASDVLAGAIAGSNAFIRSLMNLHSGPLMLLGPTMDPRVAADLSLRLPHLPLRIKEHSARAVAMANHLESLGARVIYPGLLSHSNHELMKELINPGGYGFGGLFGVDLGSTEKAKMFMEVLQNECGFGLMAVSLGYFDTLMSASAVSTSSELTQEELHAAGITPGLVRLSVGLTGTLEQRLMQLERAWCTVMGREPNESHLEDRNVIHKRATRPASTSHAHMASHELRALRPDIPGVQSFGAVSSEASDGTEQQQYRGGHELFAEASVKSHGVGGIGGARPPMKIRRVRDGDRKAALAAQDDDGTPMSPT
jgi:cystathionine beta-lyase/cystathionine gamma-synthase